MSYLLSSVHCIYKVSDQFLVCILHPTPIQRFFVACIIQQKMYSGHLLITVLRDVIFLRLIRVDSVVDNVIFLDQWHITVTCDSDEELTQFQVTETGVQLLISITWERPVLWLWHQWHVPDTRGPGLPSEKREDKGLQGQQGQREAQNVHRPGLPTAKWVHSYKLRSFKLYTLSLSLNLLYW